MEPDLSHLKYLQVPEIPKVMFQPVVKSTLTTTKMNKIVQKYAFYWNFTYWQAQIQTGPQCLAGQAR